MPRYKVVSSQTGHDLGGESFEAKNLEEAQELVLEIHGKKVEEV